MATPRADLQSAKKHALEYFPIKRQQDGATSVEVRDDNGNPVQGAWRQPCLEARYGERKAIVEAEDWEGPAYQACVDTANVCRKFPLESKPRRLDLSFKNHREVAALSAAERMVRYRSFMVCGLNCRRA